MYLATKATEPNERAPQKDENKGTIAVLDGVRAFACVSVMIFHINHSTQNKNIWSPHMFDAALSDIFRYGYSGITLFFILSGFLLFMPYAQSLLFDKPWPQLRRYYIRRIFRIWPGYYVSLILLILLLHREYLQIDHWGHLALFFSFFMDSHESTFQKLNGPFWTLAVEWQFYMLLPFIALIMRWIAQRGPLWQRFVFVLFCVFGVLVWGVFTRGWGHSWMVNSSRPTWLPTPGHYILLFVFYGQSGKYMEDFAIGMLICVIYTLAQQLPEHAISRFCYRYSRWFWSIGLLGLLFAMTWSDSFIISWYLSPYILSGNAFSELPYAIAYGVCVLALLFGPPDLRWFWELRSVRWLGSLSYGLYIWHLPMIVIFEAFLFPLVSNSSNKVLYIMYWVWVFGTAIPLSYLFHRIVELPGIQWGQRLLKKMQQPKSERAAQMRQA